MIGVLDAPMIVDVPEVAEPMKLSEAMREGAKLRPQAFGHYFDDDKSCALGAAMEAITGNQDTMSVGINEICPDYDTYFKHPICGYSSEMLAIIVSLNDVYKWTREAIADWVESQGL